MSPAGAGAAVVETSEGVVVAAVVASDGAAVVSVAAVSPSSRFEHETAALRISPQANMTRTDRRPVDE